MNTNSRKSKFLNVAFYGAADVMGGGAGQIIGLYYYVFLTFVVGLPTLSAGIVAALGRIWDGLIDPAMGIIVDRTRKKMGNSRFLMLLSVVPIIIAYFMLWSTFGISTVAGKSVYFSFIYVLWSTSYSLATVPYDSLLPKVVPEYKERTKYTVSRMIFSGIGGVSATWLYDMLIRVDEGQSLDSSFQNAFSTMGLVFGIYFAVFVLITALGVKEPSGHSFPKQDNITLRSVFKGYADVLRCKSYRKFFTLVLSGAFISNAILISMPIFALLVYGEKEAFLLTFSFSFLVVNVKGALEIGFFVPNTIIMQKYNKHRPYKFDIPLLILGALLIMIIGPSTSFWVFFIAVGLIGAGVSCLGFVPMAILPDLADAQELISGTRSDGINAGINTFGKQIIAGVATLVFGVVFKSLGVDSLQNTTPGSLDPATLLAVKIMFAIIPAAICVLILFVSATYKLDGKAQALIKKVIAEKRQNDSLNISEEDKKILTDVTGMKFESMWIGRENEASITNSSIQDQ
ncbi:MAG: MFS transporter [Christensenellaceae bacterium]|jgi:oligogalacturonide transporter|nr:MFS transporter [Christensenellaceae bacterium]